jgi:ABC-2 type transport system ATP-binding protein
MAEGEISDVRGEITHHPIQITLRCSDPSILAARLFAEDHVVEVRLHADRQGLVIVTEDADGCYRLLTRVVSDGLVKILSLAPLDEDVEAVYQYLVGQGGEGL